MKPEEVIKHLKQLGYAASTKAYALYCYSIAEEQCGAIDEAIKAVEKTIPQKLKRDPFGAECPNCGSRIVLPTTYTFGGKKIGIRCDCCYSCGQALDWSE